MDSMASFLVGKADTEEIMMYRKTIIGYFT